MKSFENTKSSRWACCWGVVAAVSLSGCTHLTALVTEGSLDANGKPVKQDGKPATVELPGILFYPKKGVCNKESVWLEPQYTLTLAVAVDGGPPQTRTVVLSRSGYRAGDTQDLLKTLTGLRSSYTLQEIYPNACPAAIGVKWDKVEGNRSYDALTPGIDGDKNSLEQEAKDGRNILLVTNKATLDAAPDYSRPLYLNALSPWNGSAQVDAKLAADGTLTEGSAQRDDQTLNTILTGITSLIGDFTGASTASSAAAAAPATPPSTSPGAVAPRRNPPPACPASEKWPGVVHKVTYTYSLKTTIYQHDHQEQSDLHGECSLAGMRVYGGNFTVTVVDEGNSSRKSGKAIEFSGQVKLPEGSGKKQGDSGAGDSSD